METQEEGEEAPERSRRVAEPVTLYACSGQFGWATALAVSATAAFAYGVLPRLKLFLVGKAARQAVKTNLLGTEKEV